MAVTTSWICAAQASLGRRAKWCERSNAACPGLLGISQLTPRRWIEIVFRAMGRYLIVGNLSKEQTQDIKEPWDIRVFFNHPEAEFLNSGPGPDIFGRQKRSTLSILTDVTRNAYELIILGNTFYPSTNPRKGWLRNAANFTKKIVFHPNLLTGAFFNYAKMKTPIVGLDMEDVPIVDNSRFPILRQSVCYFKRELPQNPGNAFLYTTSKTQCNGNVFHLKFFRDAIAKLRPISVGVDDETCRNLSKFDVPKRTDVFFSGDCTNRINRQRGLRLLEALKKEGYAIDVTHERLPRQEFLRRCAQAHLVWSPEGFGWDCFRHYEVALVGSVPLMQTPTIFRYAPLVEDEHGIYYYVEGDHLAQRIRQALQKRDHLVQMGIAARRHVLEKHTLDALSRYVIRETQETLANANLSKVGGTGIETVENKYRNRHNTRPTSVPSQPPAKFECHFP